MNERRPGFPAPLLLIPASFAALAFLLRIMLAGAPHSIATDLAQPLPVATTWHDFGRALWMLTFGFLLCACVPYALSLQAMVRKSGTLPRLRTIVLISALSLTAALCMPVIFSSDVYAYAAYGLLAAHGISPYAHSTIALHDPLLRAAIWQWSNPLPVCVYGPLFVLIAKATVIGTSALGPALQLLAMRAIASGALLACAGLIYKAFDGFSREQRIAAAAGIALNPIAIWCAAEGHNDALMLLVVLTGFIIVKKFGYFAGAFVIASSALIKASGAFAALALALFAWPDRRRFASTIGGFAAAIGLTALIAIPFESGVRTVLMPHGHYLPQFSAQYAAVQLATALFGRSPHSDALGIVAALIACGWLVFAGVRRALQKNLEGAAYIALGLWLVIPNPYPWYALWILPVAFLCIRNAASWAILALSITAFMRYLPDMSTAANADLNLAVTACELALPLALLAGRLLLPTARRALNSDAGAS